MKNYPVTNPETGKTDWVSRSVAVAVNVYTSIDGKDYVLANKRGTGTKEKPLNHPHQWNVVSGFIDYDETLKEACIREVFEETGVDISKCDIDLYKIDDDPSRENQVILFRYYCWYNGPKDVLTNEHAEPNEVEEVKWVRINEINNYEWTSEHHKKMIKTMFLTKYGLPQ